MLKTKIKDKDLNYTVDYRNVKYIRYELKEGILNLILPKRYNANVEECVHIKEQWIYEKLIEYEKSQHELKKATENKNLVNRSLDDLKVLSKGYIEKYENLLNVRVNRLQFRETTKKWGSCSSLGNVTLSKDLRFMPDDLIRYVVYHELAHLIVLSHSDKFFDIIKREFPDYEDYDYKLREYWYLINYDR